MRRREVWTRRREVWTRRREVLDASARIFTRAEVVSLPMQPNNFEFGRVGVISRMTLRRMLLIL